MPAEPGTPAASRLAGAQGRNSAGAGRLRPCGGAGLLGRSCPGELGPRSLRGGQWRQRGNPPYFPASNLTGSERFQFKPVSVQLRPICGAISPRPDSPALESLARFPALCGALGRERPALPCTPAASWRCSAAAQRAGEVPGRSFPLRSAAGRPVRSPAWLSDLGTRPPPRRPRAEHRRPRSPDQPQTS